MTVPEKAWKTASRNPMTVALVALGLGALATLATVGLFFQTDSIREGVPEVVKRQFELNCKDDRRFRLAYKYRAQAERKFLALQRRANESLEQVVTDLEAQGQAIPSISALGDRLDAVNTKLQDLREALVIYPVPRCTEQRKEAEDGKSTARVSRQKPAQRSSDIRRSPARGVDDSNPGSSGSGVDGPPSSGGSGSPVPPPENPPVPPPPSPPVPPQPPSSPPKPDPPSIGQGVGEIIGGVQEGVQGVQQGTCTTTNALGVTVPVLCP